MRAARRLSAAEEIASSFCVLRPRRRRVKSNREYLAVEEGERRLVDTLVYLCTRENRARVQVHTNVYPHTDGFIYAPARAWRAAQNRKNWLSLRLNKGGEQSSELLFRTILLGVVRQVPGNAEKRDRTGVEV